VTTEPSVPIVPVDEDQGARIATRLNWLRAGVMGANDGIVSTAGLVVGVAAASVSDDALLASGVAAVVAGALSMAVGEYVSVSSQRDSQLAELAHEERELAADPEYEIAQLAGLIAAQGVDVDLAREVAAQLTEKDPLAAHARIELGIDPEELTNPWQAGLSSMIAFVVGALVPLIAVLVAPRDIAEPVTAVAVVAALVVTGAVSARLGRAPKLRAVLRTTCGGLLAMTVTYSVGTIIDTQF
jgi:VIT1/CCC1 family predicted Fe2+/Mn2+ transporter